MQKSPIYWMHLIDLTVNISLVHVFSILKKCFDLVMFNQNWTFRWKHQTSLWWRMQSMNSNHLTCLKVYERCLKVWEQCPHFKNQSTTNTVIHYTWMNITKRKKRSIATSISSGRRLKGVLLCSFTKSWFCFGGVLEHALMLGGSKIALFFT